MRAARNEVVLTILWPATAKNVVTARSCPPDVSWRQLASASVLPETAAPSVGAFEEAFRRLHDEGADGIVCVNLSAHLSATMQSAQVAAKALDGLCPIEIIDSGTASMGIGILALHAARRASEGADVATIAAEVKARRDNETLYARSTRSSTCARAVASVARRRCSARCSRSSRSSR